MTPDTSPERLLVIELEHAGSSTDVFSGGAWRAVDDLLAMIRERDAKIARLTVTKRMLLLECIFADIAAGIDAR